jgi:hypothetical protein
MSGILNLKISDIFGYVDINNYCFICNIIS